MPKESEKCSADDGAECCKYEEAFCGCKDPECAESDDEQSSGEPVEPIGEIDGVAGADEDEHEDRNVPDPEFEISYSWYVD